MKKNYLLFFVCILTNNFAKAQEISSPEFKSVSSTIQLDHYLLGSGPANSSDFAASVKTAWDAINLYIKVEITDNILNNSAPQAWERDMVEVYFDLDNSKQAGAYDANDKDLSFFWNLDNSGVLNGKAISTQETTATGWNLDVTIPYSAIMEGFVPQVGDSIGFDIHVDDNDGGAKRVRKVAWMALEDKAWQSPSYMGTIKLLADGEVEPIYPVKPSRFVHPGGVVGQSELDYVKEKIATKQQPWLKFYYDMKSKATGGTNAMKTINSNDNSQAGPARDETWKAYANALTWYFTDDDKYAQQAIAVLNAWTVFEGFTGGNDQDKLQAGWMGAIFGPAAEIMRDYSGWAPADKNKVHEMFKRAFYPQLLTASTWNGNVDLTQIDALLNIAVFNDDEDAFNKGIARLNKRNPSYFYLESDGSVPQIAGDGNNIKGFWSYPTLWIDGLTQETCRDNDHHAQFGMASALHAAEVAWNQGVDVYTPNTDRYVETMELMSKQLLTKEMQGTCSNNATNVEYIDTWEIGYNHYHTRKGIDMPNTEKHIGTNIRSKGWSSLNIFYETLTHAHDVIVIPTDINSTGQSADISVYPNPCDNGLFEVSKEVTWEVFNTMGTKIRVGNSDYIDLSDQSSGLYLVKIDKQVIKVIIK